MERDHAPAGGGGAGRADRPDADRGVLTRSGRGRARQDHHRPTPRTARTRPASTMAGYEIVKVKTDARGNVDLDDLRGAGRRATAALMLTNPNTLGLFDERHRGDRGDRPRRGRAPLLRRRQPERDLRHLAARRHGLRHRPLQPAQDLLAAARRRRPRRRAGRRSGTPRAVPARRPSVERARTTAFGLDHDRPESIGKVRGYYGNFGVFVRAYAFIRAYGPALRGCPRSRC